MISGTDFPPALKGAGGQAMEVEIEVIGKDGKWVLNQSRIRIGRGARCDVNLPARQYPGVAAAHAELDVTGTIVRLVAAAKGNEETFINDEPAEPGAVIISGDILRLGAAGPELRIRFRSREPVNSVPSREPVWLPPSDTPGGHEPTRLMSARDSTVTQPAPMVGARVKVPPPLPTRATPSPAEPPVSPAFTQRPAPPAERQPAGADPARSARPFARSTARQIEEQDMTVVEDRLRTLQVLQVISLALVIILLFWNIQLHRQLVQTRDDVSTLRSQAQNAVSQFTPALDQRLNSFDQRMAGMDVRMKAAQDRLELSLDAHIKAAEDQMYANIDAKMKDAEEHMVDRLNNDLPTILDKYIAQRMAEIKH
jgi:pSer/pThr/pTyr-binding forkhead associated (FHA) protein